MEAPRNDLPLDDALTLYRVEHFATRNFAERTRRDYALDIEDLITYLTGNANVTTVQAVTLRHLQGFLGELDRLGRAGSSRRRKVSSIRSFFLFLTKQKIIASDPTLDLTPPMREQTQPRVLSEGEYKRLREAAAYDPRDLAIIEVLLQTGMRLTELSRLTLKDVDLPQGRISKEDLGSVTIQGKGRRTRTVTLNWKACRAIRSYLAIRPKTDSPSLFITKFREGIGPRSIENVIAKYLAEAGISGASVHTLRHTMATHMVKGGIKLDIVRQALGHTSLKTTGLYVELARDVMDEEMQKHAL